MLPTMYPPLSRFFFAFIWGAILVAGSTPAAAQYYAFTTRPLKTASGDAYGSVGGIVADAAGNLYVTNPLENTIDRIDASTGTVTTIAGRRGQSGFVDGQGSTALFTEPNGLTRDAGGNLYVADTRNDAIRKIAPDGTVTTVFGNKNGNYGVPPAQRLSNPTSVAMDRAGNLYVSDTFNNVIRRIAPDGTMTTFAGTVGVQGDLDGTGLAAKFNFPYGLAIDGTGHLFVADIGNIGSIKKISPSGEVTTLLRGGPSGRLDGDLAHATIGGNVLNLAADPAGNVFFTDSGLIRELSAGGVVTTVAGQAMNWTIDAAVDGVGGAVRFGEIPQAIAVDASDTVYTAFAALHVGHPSTQPSIPIGLATPYQSSQSVGSGQSITLRGMATGTAPLTYQWLLNGTPIAGATTSTLVLPTLSAANNGTYSETTTNAYGSVTTPVGTLLVYTPPLSSFTSRHAKTGGSFLWSIAAGRGRLVTVGTGGTILASTDGQAWAPVASGVTDWLVGVCYGAGQFVAVGDNGRVLLSSDGTTWQPATSGVTQRLNNVVYAGNQYVAVGEAGTIITSPDGRTWTSRVSGVTGWLRGLAYNGSNVTARDSSGLPLYSLVATGQGGVLLGSADGITWTPFSPDAPLTSDIEAVVPQSFGSLIFTTNEYAAIGADGVALNGERAMLSRLGPTIWKWLLRPTGIPVRLRGLAVAQNALFATGENGTILGAASALGPWAIIRSGTQANLVSGAYIGNTLYIVGENETILQSDPIGSSRLLNVSANGHIAGGTDALTGGLVIRGTTPKTVLIRASGPALTPFGVTNPVPNPVLTVYDSSAVVITSNAGWATAARPASITHYGQQVGAFPFSAGSPDSAVVLTLDPGPYTARVTDATGAAGNTLLEIYDCDPITNETVRTINLSANGTVDPDHPLTLGLVIGGNAARQVLIRGVGPALAAFHVAHPLAQPRLTLYSSSGYAWIKAGAWSAQANADEIATDSALVGAFALPSGSQDTALAVRLNPGNWTVQITSGDGTSGAALAEVYDVP